VIIDAGTWDVALIKTKIRTRYGHGRKNNRMWSIEGRNKEAFERNEKRHPHLAMNAAQYMS